MAIDNGMAFNGRFCKKVRRFFTMGIDPYHINPQRLANYQGPSREVRERLERTGPEEFSEKLKGLISKDELDNFLARREHVLKNSITE